MMVKLPQISYIPQERILQKIVLLRRQKVLLAQDLAALYGIPTSRLNEQVKRNRDRFPEDFMFQLTNEEYAHLRSQNAMSSWGGRRVPPYAFTDYGVAMLASVLKSQQATAVNIQIIRTFILLRRMIASHDELQHKINQLEQKYDTRLKEVFDLLQKYMHVAPTRMGRIGFDTPL
jgi:hypothetical protein